MSNHWQDLDLEAQHTHYVVTVDATKFSRLLKREFEDPGIQQSTLCTDLDKLPGVSNTNYDGHFGNCIHFDLEEEEDTHSRHSAIKRLIQQHLDRK